MMMAVFSAVAPCGVVVSILYYYCKNFYSAVWNGMSMI
jgi:hypothetical protein